MSKTEFVKEYEFRASKKMLYPYLSSAGGLSQWFADDVNINDDKELVFIWEGEEVISRVETQKKDHYIKFVFAPTEDDPDYVHFELDMNELTQSVFLRIKEYTDIEDEEESAGIWDNLIMDLKEIVGG